MQNNYILATGEKGSKRLESVQALYGNESAYLLNTAGLREGMKVLDLGCGSGQMTKWIAEEIGPRGSVIALDNSEDQLDVARAQLEISGLKNIHYLCKNIVEITKNDLQDIGLIYARLVLLHNKNPRQILKKILDTASKNTILVLEEPITKESCCYPQNKAFDNHLELYLKLGEVEGYNFNFGQKLIDFLLYEGIFPQGIRKVRCSYTSEIVKLIAYRRTLECADKYLKWGLIGKEELDMLLSELKELSNRKLIISGVSMMQAWAIL